MSRVAATTGEKERQGSAGGRGWGGRRTTTPTTAGTARQLDSEKEDDPFLGSPPTTGEGRHLEAAAGGHRQATTARDVIPGRSARPASGPGARQSGGPGGGVGRGDGGNPCGRSPR